MSEKTINSVGPKKFTMPVGWSLKQATIEKLGGMNREQRRKWAKDKKNRRGA